jgi:hypothetical protein
MLEGLAGRIAHHLDDVSPTAFVDEAIAILVSGGLDEPIVWVADLGSDVLVDMSGVRPPVAIDGTVEGAVFTTHLPSADGGRVHVPLAQRGQAIGVLSVGSIDSDEDLRPVTVSLTSSLLALDKQSDVLAVARRAQRLSLPATIQRNLLPNNSHAGARLEIAGHIEPAYDVAGDVFDYAVNPDGVHLALFDAVGHGLRSALIVSAAVGAYRRARRSGASVGAMATELDELLGDVLSPGEFVTGLLIRLDTGQGTGELWNAGHPPPLIATTGGVEQIDGASPRLPFGLGTAGEATTFQIAPDDLVLLYTDGVVEARDPDDVMLDVAYLHGVAGSHRAGGSLPAICHEVMRAVRSHVQGDLADDATLLLCRVRSAGSEVPIA